MKTDLENDGSYSSNELFTACLFEEILVLCLALSPNCRNDVMNKTIQYCKIAIEVRTAPGKVA
jgi:hypothetical protein